MNKASSFIDAGFLYGAGAARVAELRTGCRGELKAQRHPRTGASMLPLNDMSLQNDNPLSSPVDAMFVAGDPRTMENAGLVAMHTLWLRRHNWLASKLLAARCARRRRALLHAEALPKGVWGRGERGKGEWGRGVVTKYTSI